MVQEHGRGFLNIIKACMEEWVEREVGALLEIESVFAPGHGRVGQRHFHFVEACLEGIQPDACRGLGSESFDELQIPFASH